MGQGDPGMVKVDQDIPALDLTEEGFRSWQKPCFSGEKLAFNERTWHSLPARKEARLSWVSRTAAQLLRHEDLHDEDGSVFSSSSTSA